jgi:glycosyltransferase involved in cell wall biosynthesis
MVFEPRSRATCEPSDRVALRSSQRGNAVRQSTLTANTRDTRVLAFYPNYNNDAWVSHICVSLCEHMRGTSLALDLLVPASDPHARRGFIRDAVPSWLRRAVYRLDKSERLSRMFALPKFKRALANVDATYLWAAVPLSFFDAVARRGVPLVLERINCHRRTSMRILDEAFAKVGLPASHGNDDRTLAEEDEKLRRAALVFSPSPWVKESLLEAGIPEHKILASSYGWSPQRIRPRAQAPNPDAPFTVLFVGSLCIRKGAHLLLDVWAASGIAGRLLLAGRVEKDFATVCGHLMQRDDVEYLGLLRDVNAAFERAHAFAMPTLEEGSPLVVYEAMAHGLAILTSPMGAGAVLRDGVDGLVRAPHDRDAWIAELRRLARDHDLCARLGQSARARVSDFTWDKVGARRRAQLLAALG